MRRIAVAVLVAAAGLVSLPAAAQFAKPEQAIKYRQSAMSLLATHFGRVAAMAQGKAPFDAKAAAENAMLAQTIAALPFAAFGPGTDKGAPNRAKPEVWTNPDFKKGAEAMQQAMAKLAEAAKAGTVDAIKGPAGDVGKTCKGCHDDFKTDDLRG